METIATNVVRRFQARQGPPRWMTEAVDAGEVSPDAVDIWDYVVSALGGHYEEYAAAAYWRNKAAKVGFVVPEQIIPMSKAFWKVSSNDSVEDWAKKAKRSKVFVTEQNKLIRQWEATLNKAENAVSSAEPDKARLLGEGQALLTRLRSQTLRHTDHNQPVIAFERAFQFALLVADKALDKSRVANDLIEPGDAAAFKTFKSWLGNFRKGVQQLEKSLSGF